jgi:DNA invertase Pin-like site-specific DNA recombinase
MRLLGYTRVSTAGQDPALQLDALLAAGVQKRDVFSDVTSGAKSATERPGMKNLLAYAEPEDTVVVWRIRDRGVKIQSVSDGIAPDTSSGRLMLGMLATLAEYERELITERVNAGIAAARAQGTKFGRPPVNPEVVERKLAIAAEERAKGRTAEEAARVVGWSRATLYRHQRDAAARESIAQA